MRAVALVTIFALAPALAFAIGSDQLMEPSVSGSSRAPQRVDTLWIFDADFEDLLGDNAGWTAEDQSGRPPSANYWHKDTIRLDGNPVLGDSTWWCGKSDDCWFLSPGYANNWTCSLERDFPEVAAQTDPGDPLTLEWDHRFAMEGCYDYGYVDVSTDGGSSWLTVDSFTNYSCALPPGGPQDAWAHAGLNLSAYAGLSLSIRYLFTSDDCCSSKDGCHPIALHDGAWQLDNIHLWTEEGEEEVTLFLDDCESPGTNGWMTEDYPGSDQTRITFRRALESFGGHTGWMMAAYDTVSGAMVSGQRSHLYSPAIEVPTELVPGEADLIVKSEGWLDLPDGSDDDYVVMSRPYTSELECIEDHAGNYTRIWSEEEAGPVWVDRADTVHYPGGGWFGLSLFAWGRGDPAPHSVGFVLDRVRVGLPPDPTGLPDGASAVASMSRAHPNPLGESTVVSYVLPARGRVTIRIVNLAGRVVATLVDAVTDPGEHTAVWDGATDDGERAASGVYFVRMEADGVPAAEGAARKVVLLK